MGKASGTKRERREAAGSSQLTPGAAARAAGPGTAAGRSGPSLFWVAVALIVVGGLVALVMTRPDASEQKADAKAASVPTFADVRIEGAQLPTWSGTRADPAEGETMPTITATRFDGMKSVIDPEDGVPRVIVTLAHWCPHCQAEVPRIVKWAKDGGAPEGVEIMALSTAVSDSQVNFPPAKWLAEEQWPYETLIDDEVGSASDALGVEGYPFITFVNADGTVSSRYSGEMPIDEFDEAVRAIA